MNQNLQQVNLDELDVSILWHSFTRDPDFHGLALSVSSENEVGPFDILPLHANLITQIRKQIIVRVKEGKEIKYQFTNGVIEVSENKVKVFLGL